MNYKLKEFLYIAIILFLQANLLKRVRCSPEISHRESTPEDPELEEHNFESMRMLQNLGSYHVVGTEEIKDQSLHYNLEYSQGAIDSFRGSEILKNLKLEISFDTKSSVRVKITNRDSPRWEIPEINPFPSFKIKDKQSKEGGCCKIDVTHDPFSLKITRKDNQQTIFDTTGLTFIYSDLYIEIGTKLPSDNVYGYGERNYKFKLGRGKYTIWGRDEPRVKETTFGGGNVYGHHPVGLVRDAAGSFFIMVMKNSNAMDVEITNEKTLKYLMTGGVIDLVFFLGDEFPDTAIKQYHDFVGNFVMMPFWSMGHHQCRWGYRSITHHKNVLAKYKEHEIPLDVIWSDIDYMIEKEDFTIDQHAFPPKELREMLEHYQKHWVPIIDAGVKGRNSRGNGYKEGVRRDIFVKSSKGGYLTGEVWPGQCHFVDFFNPKAENYWIDMLEDFYKTVPFDGIWLDMNEIANFVHGEIGRYDSNKYDNLPYTPGARQLKTKTLSMDAVHSGNLLEFNVHDLHSILQNKATYFFLRSKSPLPFILTRSSSFGTGQFSAHWTGDNYADWEFLKYSLAGNFNFQIFGAPFVGADICGFDGNTTPELCSRWIQIGALYPFSRNHNEQRARDQEPWAFGDDYQGSLLTKTYRESLRLRYSILKWFYSLFIATRGRGSIWRPLIFEFSREEILYTTSYNEFQFLMGSHVMVTPVLDPGKASVEAYFPISDWFDYYTGEKVIEKSNPSRVKQVKAPLGMPPPVWIRDGYILHSQDIRSVASTSDLGNMFGLNIAFSEKQGEWIAEGDIMGIAKFDDNSVHSRCVEKNCLYHIKAETDFKRDNLRTVVISFDSQDKNLDEIMLISLRFFGHPYIKDNNSNISECKIEVRGDKSNLQSGTIGKIEESNYAGTLFLSFKDIVSVKAGYSIKVQIPI